MAKEIEIETKIGIGDPEKVEGQLRELGAQSIEEQRSVFSLNVFFDHAGHKLSKRGELLRVRELRREDKRGQPVLSLLTFKGRRLHPENTVFKKQPERNVGIELGKAEEMISALKDAHLVITERLEYLVISVWRWKRVEIALKKLPFLRHWMEPEGPEAEIEELFELLGLDINQATSKTYEGLLEDFCCEEGLPYERVLANFTFDYEQELAQQG